MNEKLIEVLDKLLQWAEAAEGMTMEQAPLLLQEIITWGIVWNGIWLLLTVCTLPLLVRSWKWGVRETKEEPMFLIPAIATVCWIPTFICALYTLLQIWLTPQLYIIEKLRGML